MRIALSPTLNDDAGDDNEEMILRLLTLSKVDPLPLLNYAQLHYSSTIIDRHDDDDDDHHN